VFDFAVSVDPEPKTVNPNLSTVSPNTTKSPQTALVFRMRSQRFEHVSAGLRLKESAEIKRRKRRRRVY
jgi:hypothetical protein